MHDFRLLLRHLSRLPINGLVLFGIASEFMKLRDSERFRLASVFSEELKDSRINAFISITHHSLESAMHERRLFEAMKIDGFMLLHPFSLSPPLNNIKRHILSFTASTALPIMIQYAPSETSFPIKPDEMASWLAGHPNMIFKIESNPPVEYSKELLRLAPEARIMNGYAGLYMIDMLSIGAKGVMPGCFFAEIYAEIYRLLINGSLQSAKDMHSGLFPYIRMWMSHVEYIIAVEKVILFKRCIISSPYVRSPGWTLSQEDLDDISRFLSEFAALL